jgi:hypothetical protein
MYRNEAQQCQAIRILLSSLNLQHLWTEKGPTQRACEWLESSPLSSGEQVLLRCAFDFWNGEGKVTLYRDLLGTLDSPRLGKVLTLAMAVNSGSETVDRWISQEGPFEDIAS